MGRAGGADRPPEGTLKALEIKEFEAIHTDGDARGTERAEERKTIAWQAFVVPSSRCNRTPVRHPRGHRSRMSVVSFRSAPMSRNTDRRSPISGSQAIRNRPPSGPSASPKKICRGVSFLATTSSLGLQTRSLTPAHGIATTTPTSCANQGLHRRRTIPC